MTMDVSFTRALNAYQNRMKAMDGAQESTGEAGSTGDASFGGVLSDALGAVAQTQQKAEAVSLESLTGKVELADLVTAVSNAELTLNTVVAVRDRVISAYQDIMRMPI